MARLYRKTGASGLFLGVYTGTMFMEGLALSFRLCMPFDPTIVFLRIFFPVVFIIGRN